MHQLLIAFLFHVLSAYAQVESFQDCDTCPEMIVTPSGSVLIIGDRSFSHRFPSRTNFSCDDGYVC